MTSALLRGSNLEKDIPKYLVIPEEREIQLKNKMSSPLFEQHFTNENWRVLYFDAIRNSHLKYKDQIDLDSMSDKLIIHDNMEEYKTCQMEIFN